MELKFFDTLTDVTTYVADESIATCQDELDRMGFAQEHLYSDDERREMAARLADIRSAAPLIAHAAKLWESLETAFRTLDGISDRLHYQDGEPVTALETREIDEIYADAVSALADMEALIIKAAPVPSGPSPVALAKAITPFWFSTIHNYDGLELAPVAEYEEKAGTKFCERVDNAKDAQFWSVYGHLREGGVECLEDFKTEQEATAFAEQLLSLFPNLGKFGLIRC